MDIDQQMVFNRLPLNDEQRKKLYEALNAERQTVRGAVALDDDSAQAEQSRTVVIARIETPFECIEHGKRRQARRPGQQIAVEFFA